MSKLLKISGRQYKPTYNKYDDPEYMMQRVITHSTRIRTLLTAIRVPFVGPKTKRLEEARDLVHEASTYLHKVSDHLKKELDTAE